MAELTLDQKRALAMANARLRLQQQNAPMTRTQAAGEGFQQGLSFGLSDEMAANAAASQVRDQQLGERLRASQSAQPITSDEQARQQFMQQYEAKQAREQQKANAYNQELTSQRRDLSNAREQYPVTAFGAEIAGAIPTAIGATPKLVQAGAPLMKRVGQSALEAGIGGAVYGFNTGEGGLQDRAQNAAVSAAISAPIGAAAPVIGQGINRAFRPNPAKQLGVDRSTARMVAETIASGDDLATARARAMSLGDDAMLADSSPAAMSMLDTAAQSSPRAATLTQRALDQRLTGANQRIGSAMDTYLGPAQGVRQTARGIAQESAPARQAAYDAAFNAPIDYASEAGRKIEGVFGRIPKSTLQKAIQEANDDMVAEGVRNMQILANIADDGTVQFIEMPNVRQLDAIKRALNSIASENVDQFGRPTAQARRASMLAQQLRDSVQEAVPEYSEALRLGGDKIAEDRALDLGRKLLNRATTREIVQESVDGMTAAEKARVAQGARYQIDEALANVRRAMSDSNMDARQAMQAVKDLSSDAARQKMALVLGDDAAKSLFKELDQASAALEMRAGLAMNSRTFARQNMNEQMAQMTDEGALNRFRSGQPVGSAKELAARIMGRSPEAKRAVQDKAKEKIAQLLLQKATPQTFDALEQVMNPTARMSPARQAIIEALMRRQAPASGSYINQSFAK